MPYFLQVICYRLKYTRFCLICGYNKILQDRRERNGYYRQYCICKNYWDSPGYVCPFCGGQLKDYPQNYDDGEGGAAASIPRKPKPSDGGLTTEEREPW